MLTDSISNSWLTIFSSDPYVKVTVYDPVDGILTSVQTKTIKKVSLFILHPYFYQNPEEKAKTKGSLRFEYDC